MTKNVLNKLLLILLMALFFGLPSLFAGTSFHDEEIPYGPYYIQSAKDYSKNWNGCWDIPGVPHQFKKGQNICVWDVTKQDSINDDRQFYIRKAGQGLYQIGCMLSPKARNKVDVAGGRRKNGTNVGLWTTNGGDNQAFRFKHLGNGRWKIYTTTGKILCLKGRSSKNGSNVHIWDDHNGPWCEWVLVNVKSRTAFIPAPPIKVSLEEACRDMDGNRGRRYFGKVNYKRLARDNDALSIHEILNAMDEDVVAALQNIILAVRDNKKSIVRGIVYGELNRVDFSVVKSNFALRLQLGMIKETLKSTAKHEKDTLARKHLQALIKKM
ncbi:RICIN domain-containing protein [Desulfoluna sp.]|uniref:RICIN domain-containing protein n=1 Tax=Desulfoluna sp. TaxID=2045199 RepID=UPI002637A674|nr:RICIN domain-containing protein [Desulfoluna sp.]